MLFYIYEQVKDIYRGRLKFNDTISYFTVLWVWLEICLGGRKL